MGIEAISTVYSYGGGKILNQTFNAISMLFNSGVVSTLLDISLIMGFIWVGIKMGLKNDAYKETLKWLFCYLFVVIFLVHPASVFRTSGMTMHVRDVVTGKAYKIDHVPPGLVIPASLLSSIGFSMTKAFETVFSTVDDNYMPYHQYGMMFGARVISEMRNMTIQDGIFMENMSNFIKNCVIYDTMIGKNYDIRELKMSNDVWGLIRDHSSNIRMMNYRSANKVEGRSLVSCKTAAQNLEKYFNPEAELLGRKFAILSGLANKSRNNTKITNAIELASKGFYDKRTFDASRQLQQILTINALADFPKTYGATRAIQSQNSAWITTGEVAQTMIPVIHAIFQMLIYAVFPILLMLLLLTQSYGVLKHYFELMLWIELWPILFAVLNLSMSIFARNAGSEADLTLNSISNITSVQSSYAAAAASLTALVPVMSYMLMRGGVSSFTHIAGSVMGATNGGVSMASNELTSGNLSLDNISLHNRSFNNLNANKQDSSGYISGSMMKRHLPSGVIKTDFIGNQPSIYQSGEGLTMSSHGYDITTQHSHTYASAQDVQESISNTLNQSKGYEESVQKVHNQAVNFLARTAESHYKGMSHELSSNTREAQSYNNFLHSSKEFHENYNKSWEQIGQAGVNADLGAAGNYKISSVKGGDNVNKNQDHQSGVDTKLALGADASFSARNFDTQNVAENKNIVSGNNVDQNIEMVVYAAKNLQYNESNQDEKALADDLTHAYNEMQQKRESLEFARNQQEMIQASYNSAKSYAITMTHRNDEGFKKHLMQQKGLNNEEAIRFMEHGDPNEVNMHAENFAQTQMPRNVQRDNRHYHKQYDNVASGKTELVRTSNATIDNKTDQIKNDLAAKKATAAQKHFGNNSVDHHDVANKIDSKMLNHQRVIQEQKMKNTSEKQLLKQQVDQAEASAVVRNSAIGRKLGIGKIKQQDNDED